MARLRQLPGAAKVDGQRGEAGLGRRQVQRGRSAAGGAFAGAFHVGPWSAAWGNGWEGAAIGAALGSAIGFGAGAIDSVKKYNTSF